MHDPEKPALGLDPRVADLSEKDHASNQEVDECISKQQHSNVQGNRVKKFVTMG
jgi:hypothetical protein